MSAQYSAVGRHRGQHRDPVGAVLAGIRALGHVVTVLLLGGSIIHQLDSDHLGSPQAARSAPDAAPLA